MSYYILPKNNNNINININAHNTHNTHNNENVLGFQMNANSLYNYYNELKNQIVKICLTDNNDISYNTFDEIIKIVNPYEYIFSKVPGSKFSVSKLKPKTNLFYDFLEVSITLNTLECFKNKKINSLHITPNYNDTIECFEMMRENFTDDIVCYDKITDSTIQDIGDQKFDFLFFEANKDPLESYVLNLIEIVMIILRNQNNQGVTIIKISHIFHKTIVEILYLLSSLFEKIYVIKPNSSNVTTFDKYIVCKNFIINETKLTQYKINYYRFLIFLKKNENKNISSIFDFEIPYYFSMKLDDINIIIGQQQLESLDQIISILKNKNRDDKIEMLKKTNIQKSVNWCEKYKIPCNKFTDKINIFLPIIKDGIHLTDNIVDDSNFIDTNNNVVDVNN